MKGNSMHNLSNAGDDVVAQLVVAQRLLSDVSARLVSTVDAAARPGMPHDDQIGVPFGYTNSLEGLIVSGRKYGTIYAEPPWPCDESGRPSERGRRRQQMTVECIAALPVDQLAAPASHLHIWTPDRFLRDAMKMIEAWGFAYSGSMVWVSPELAAGAYWGIGHQYLILGVRGDAHFSKYHPRSWLFDAKDSITSEWKPYAIRALVAQVGPSPRLHLFHESTEHGWTTWGQRVPGPFEDDDDCAPDKDDGDCETEEHLATDTRVVFEHPVNTTRVK